MGATGKIEMSTMNTPVLFVPVKTGTDRDVYCEIRDMRDWNVDSNDLVIQRKTDIMNEFRLSVTNPDTIVQLLGQSSIIYAIMNEVKGM